MDEFWSIFSSEYGSCGRFWINVEIKEEVGDEYVLLGVCESLLEIGEEGDVVGDENGVVVVKDFVYGFSDFWWVVS